MVVKGFLKKSLKNFAVFCFFQNGNGGGGACAVQHASAADGTLFQISSPKHLSIVSNGAYYTIDRGVDPHYYFSKAESYFDREALTDYINELK